MTDTTAGVLREATTGEHRVALTSIAHGDVELISERV